MVTSFATGLIALSLVVVAWVTVQLAWRQVFPSAGADPDALAGRLTCHGTCEPQACTRRCPDRPGATEEDDR
jgi:hypothetical protein